MRHLPFAALGRTDVSARLRAVHVARRALLLGALATLLVPAAVAAHADLVGSTVTEGQVVPSGSLGAISLTFSEDLGAGSKVELVGPGIDTTADWAAGDGRVLSMRPPDPLPPGSYELRWTSVATDGDILRGIIHFTVTPATGSPSSLPSAGAVTQGPSPTPTSPLVPSPAPSASPNGGTSSGSLDLLLPIALVLALVAIGFGLLRGRSRAT